MNNNPKNHEFEKLLSSYYKRRAPFTFRVKERKDFKKEFCVMKKSTLIKALSVAACMALIVTAIIAVPRFSPKQENSFAIVANAQTASPDEVSEKSFTTMPNIAWENFSLSRERFALPIAFNMSVKGKNIDTVTYKMNNGVFEVYSSCKEAKERKKVKNTEYYTWFPGYDSVSEYTVDYNNQPKLKNDDVNNNDMSPVAIPILLTDKDGAESKKLLDKSFDVEEMYNVKKSSELIPKRDKCFYDMIKYYLDDKSIDVTAGFKDGSTLTKTIKIGVKYQKGDFSWNNSVFTVKLVDDK